MSIDRRLNGDEGGAQPTLLLGILEDLETHAALRDAFKRLMGKRTLPASKKS